MPFVRPTVVIGLDLVHDSDLGTQAFARHVGEHLTEDRARLVVAGMRGVLEGKADLVAEAARAFPDVDLSAAGTGPDVVAVLATAAGLTPAEIADAGLAAAHDLARSAWTVGPAPGLVRLRQVVTGNDHRLAVLAPSPVGVPEILDAVEMPDLPWVVVPRADQQQWWRDAVRAPTGSEMRTAEPDPGRGPRRTPPAPGDHLAIADHPADLVGPAGAGVRTALVDRSGRLAPGTAPTWSVTDLAALTSAITPWLEQR